MRVRELNVRGPRVRQRRKQETGQVYDDVEPTCAWRGEIGTLCPQLKVIGPQMVAWPIISNIIVPEGDQTQLMSLTEGLVTG